MLLGSFIGEKFFLVINLKFSKKRCFFQSSDKTKVISRGYSFVSKIYFCIKKYRCVSNKSFCLKNIFLFQKFSCPKKSVCLKNPCLSIVLTLFMSHNFLCRKKISLSQIWSKKYLRKRLMLGCKQRF